MNKTILALDVFDFKKAEKLVKDLSPYIDIFKIGPILFLQCGKEIIKMINDNGKKVFLETHVKTLKSWRDREDYFKELGLKDEN